MAQHDYVIANQSGSSFRADLNNALAAIVSNNSGTSAPSTTYAYQWWADTTDAQLKLRNAANDGWIVITELDGTLLMQDGTSAAPGLPFASDLNTGLFRPSADVLGISTGGAERVKFTSTEAAFNDGSNDVDFRVESNNNANMLFIDAGNDLVGIKTATPSSYFAGADDLVVASSGSTGITIASSTTESGYICFADGTTGSEQYRGIIEYDHDNDSLAFTTAAAQRFFIKSTGDVDVNGNIKLADSGTGASFITGTKAGNSFYIGCDNSTGSTFGSGTAYSPIIYTGAAAPITFSNSGSEKARIDSSGRLIIGQSTTPTSGIGQYSKLFVAGNTSGANQPAYVTLARGVAASTITSGQGIGFLTFSGNEGSSFAHIACHADADAGASDYPGRLEFHTTADGASSSTQRMRIRSDGHIGINHNGGTNQQVYVSGATGVQTALYAQGNGAGNSYGVHGFATNSANIAYGVYGNVTVTSTFSSGGVLGYSINNNTYGIVGYWSTSAYWSFYGNGPCGATGFTNVSDSRLKDVDSDLTGCLDKLANIQPVKYSWKENSQQRRSVGDRLEIGLLAEEVQAQFPELVSEMEWGEVTGANPETLNEQLGTTLGVDYGRMTAVLIQALNEAKARIETLEAKVSALENA